MTLEKETINTVTRRVITGYRGYCPLLWHHLVVVGDEMMIWVHHRCYQMQCIFQKCSSSSVLEDIQHVVLSL